MSTNKKNKRLEKAFKKKLLKAISKLKASMNRKDGAN